MPTNQNNSYDFTIYNKILDYSQYVRTHIANSIPSINRDIRIHLLDEIYNLSKNMFYAIYNKGNIRMKYIIEMQVNISLIDMLIRQIQDLKCLPKKHIDSSIKKISEIKNIIYAWKYNEEGKKK